MLVQTNLELEQLRWVSLVSISNPRAGMGSGEKSLCKRLRYWGEVRLKIATLRLPLMLRLLRSRAVTCPSSS